MKRAFVTGGSGFLGKRLIAALVGRGVEVVALVRSDAAAAKVAAIGARTARGDLDDSAGITAGLVGCDAVFHSAAHVEEHGKLSTFMAINVDGTRRVMAAAKAAGVAKIVHVSTEAVLADGKPIIRADETRPLPAKPMGPYPITKGLAEGVAREVGAVVIRPRFIWGNGDTSLLPKLVEAVKRGKFGWVGGGRYLTSTCHVDNVVEGAVGAVERGRPGEVYFLTDGEPVEFRGFLTRMLATAGVDASKARDVPIWAAKTVALATCWMKQPPVTRMAIALIGHEVTVVDAKARRELGYLGKVTIDAGLAEMTAATAALAADVRAHASR